jgi:AcrR family transcriptional regulator
MSRAVRKNPGIRRQLILDSAIRLSIKVGYRSITRDAVADIAETSSSAIAKYFPRMTQLKYAVMSAAVSHEIVEVIAQGLAINDPQALKIDDNLKQKVMHYLSQLK